MDSVKKNRILELCEKAIDAYCDLGAMGKEMDCSPEEWAAVCQAAELAHAVLELLEE